MDFVEINGHKMPLREVQPGEDGRYERTADLPEVQWQPMVAAAGESPDTEGGAPD